METPAHRVQLVQAESAQLAHYLHALPPEAWHRPSACDRWEVRDVAGHLILGTELYQSAISRGLQGNTAPLEGFPQAGTVNAASAVPLFDQMSVARRESLGDQLLSTLTATSDQLHQILARWPTRLGDPLLSSRWCAACAALCGAAAFGAGHARVGHPLTA